MKFDPNETKNDIKLTTDSSKGSEVDILYKLGTKKTLQITLTNLLYAIILRFVGVLHAQLRVLRIAYKTQNKRKTNSLQRTC